MAGICANLITASAVVASKTILIGSAQRAARSCDGVHQFARDRSDLLGRARGPFFIQVPFVSCHRLVRPGGYLIFETFGVEPPRPTVVTSRLTPADMREMLDRHRVNQWPAWMKYARGHNRREAREATCLRGVHQDSSPNPHATKHAHASRHPVISSAEDGERWFYCSTTTPMNSSQNTDLAHGAGRGTADPGAAAAKEEVGAAQSRTSRCSADRTNQPHTNPHVASRDSIALQPRPA